MDAALDLGLVWLITWLCLIPAAVATLLYLVTQRGPLAARRQEYAGIVAPFFASVGILFALFAAFLGADIWRRVQDSNHSLSREVAAVQSLLQIADALGDDGDGVATGTRRYIDATLTDDLATGGEHRSAESDEALEALVQEILRLPDADHAQSAAQGEMLAAYEVIWQGRATRRHIADTHSDPYKWVAVIVLGVLTQVALAMCHIDRPKPLIVTQLVFALAFATTLVALALHERPLANPELVSLDNLYRIAGVDLNF